MMALKYKSRQHEVLTGLLMKNTSKKVMVPSEVFMRKAIYIMDY
jgi:hypothetical protein